jgi:hypothetical protein
MPEKYSIERTELAGEWDDLVLSSHNGTIFSRPNYLQHISARSAAYFVIRGEEIRGGIAVIESDCGKHIIANDNVIYGGLIFSPPQVGQNISQRRSEEFRLASFVAEELVEKFQSVDMTLHPSIEDSRPFQWVNYGTDLPKYDVENRYTTIVSIEELNSTDDFEKTPLFLNTAKSRRQEIRYGKQKDNKTFMHFDARKFVNLYEATMNRQGIKVMSEVTRGIMKVLEGAYNAGFGRMYVTQTGDGDIGSMAFFLVDRGTAYFLYGANDPAIRNCHTGTTILWDSFYLLRREGISRVDLEGVNSPQRGWFKLSFGGVLAQYFRLCWLG